MILDKAGQKGTGIWTLQSAIRQSVVISTINAAVEARVISSRKEERVAASKILPQPKLEKFKGDRTASCRCSARRALRVENCVLRAGNGASAFWKHRIQLEPQPERHRHHLARRLHHSREISQPDRRSISARPRTAQSSARSLFHESHQESAAQLASACYRQLSNMAWPPLRFLRRWLTSIVIARRVCRRISCRRNAISLAPTLTSASISPAFFTPNGSSPIKNQPKNPPNPKRRSRITRVSNL